MNNRQAGAYRELVRKEERAREQWQQHFGHLLAEPNGTSQAIKSNGNSTLRPITPSVPIANHAVYEQALRVSSPRIVDEEDPTIPQTITRKVVRQVEVPYVRQVKVPVKTQQIVPVNVTKKIRTKKLIEVPTYKEVDETYTEVIQQPAIRQKEIWIKKVVPERYMQPVEISKTRRVKVPATEIREVDAWETVDVMENKTVEVDGYRVDQVKDSKLMEVEEYQTYELRPHARGQAEVISTRDLGSLATQYARRTGPIYSADDNRINNIDMDIPHATTLRASKTLRGAGKNTLTSRSHTQPLSTTTDSSRIGFKVKEGGAVNGVIVNQVTQGESAERAGVHVGDVIMYVNNRPSRTVAEFRHVITSTTGPVLLQVKRRGVQKLLLTLLR